MSTPFLFNESCNTDFFSSNFGRPIRLYTVKHYPPSICQLSIHHLLEFASQVSVTSWAGFMIFSVCNFIDLLYRIPGGVPGIPGVINYPPGLPPPGADTDEGKGYCQVSKSNGIPFSLSDGCSYSFKIIILKTSAFHQLKCDRHSVLYFFRKA